jgi:hypothetical protein
MKEEIAITRTLTILPPEDSFTMGAVGVIAGAGFTTGTEGQHSDSAPRINP